MQEGWEGGSVICLRKEQQIPYSGTQVLQSPAQESQIPDEIGVPAALFLYRMGFTR